MNIRLDIDCSVLNVLYLVTFNTPNPNSVPCAVGRLAQCTALTMLDLSECNSLTCLPDLSGVPGLKKLHDYWRERTEGRIRVEGLPDGLAKGAGHTRMHQPL